MKWKGIIPRQRTKILAAVTACNLKLKLKMREVELETESIFGFVAQGFLRVRFLGLCFPA